MQVHVDRGGERFGPYSLEEVNAYLANGTLLPTDQAWQDGMTDWVPITQIPGVTMSGGAAAPPPPQPVRIDLATKSRPKKPIEEAKRSIEQAKAANSAAAAGCGFALLVIVVLGVLWYQGYWSPSGILDKVSSVLEGSKVTKVTIKAGEATITDREDDGLSHLKLECNDGLVIDVDWKRNPLDDFGYDIHEPVINMTYNRFAVMILARGVIASYLRGEYD